MNFLQSLPKSGPNRVSIISYNILADVFAQSTLLPIYSQYCPQECLAWEYRVRTLREQFSQFNADIFCLQEVSLPNWEEDFGKFFSELGYCSLVQDDKNRSDTHTTGNAIVYRQAAFSPSVVESRSRAIIAGLRRLEVRPLSGASQHDFRDDLKSIAKNDLKKGDAKALKRVDFPGSLLWVCNVHLQGDPSAGETRLLQVRSALKRLRALQLRSEHVPGSPAAPTIICGDFNSGAGSAVHELLSTGVLPANFVEPGQMRPFAAKAVTNLEGRYISAYACSSLPFTFSVAGFLRDILDFVFYSERGLWLRGLLQPFPTSDTENVVAGLPRRGYPSDHLPVGAVFEFADKDDEPGLG
jgi:mRNA deadenylase 3'-5' endonuclease subunit Ccr4